MRIYLVATGVVFALVVVAHVARLFVEGVGPLSEPMFDIATLVAIALFAWAIVLLRQLSKERR